MRLSIAVAKAPPPERLLDAAEKELLANSGHLEMAPVAKRAKASVGLAYHHFGSKAGLIAAVVDRFYEPLRDIALGDAIPADLDWASREFTRMKATTDYFYDAPLAPLICGRLAREPEVLDIEKAHMTELLALGARNIAQGQRLGVVSADLNPDVTVALLMGGHRLALEQAVTASPRPDRQALVNQVWKFTAQALQMNCESLPTAGPTTGKPDQ